MGIAAVGDDNLVAAHIKPHHVERVGGGNAQALALADGVVVNARVLTQNAALGIDDIPRFGCEVLVEEGLHGAVLLDQTEVLAVGLFGGV